MSTNSLNITFVTDQSAAYVYNSVIEVTKWWTENLIGDTKTLDGEFTVQFEEIHYSKQKLIELISNKRITWLVTESHLSWLKNKQEWTGTKIVFEILDDPKGTKLQFTHVGLIPDIECFKDCSIAWTQYISSSLYKLITTGKGQPEKTKIYEQE